MTIDKVMELINGSLFADLGFVDEEGMPGIRRVFCTWHKGLAAHLISTNTSSVHVQSLLKDGGKACLYFADSSKYIGVCFTGKVVVHFEEAYKKMLWRDGDDDYYPTGPADDDYCVVEFIAEEGRYYRFDGTGDISGEEILEYSKGKEYEDYYDSCISRQKLRTEERI